MDSWLTTFDYETVRQDTEEVGVALFKATERRTQRVFALRRYEPPSGLLKKRHAEKVRELGRILDELRGAVSISAIGLVRS